VVGTIVIYQGRRSENESRYVTIESEKPLGSEPYETVSFEDVETSLFCKFGDWFSRIMRKCAQHGFETNNPAAPLPRLFGELERMRLRHQHIVEPIMRKYIAAGAALRTKRDKL
jgi:hypothetical protein